MKLLFIIALMIHLSASADVSSVTVDVDGQTYSCVGNGQSSSCSGADDSFKLTMKYCYKQHSGITCAKKHWPIFKKNFPTCFYKGTKTCIDYCYKQKSGSYCAELCQ